MNFILEDDLKALKRVENIILQQTKVNNIHRENLRLRTNNKQLIKENKLLLDILNDCELNREQSEAIIQMLSRKIYK